MEKKKKVSKPKYGYAACLNCGKRFPKNHKNKEFCKPNCRIEYYWKRKLGLIKNA